MAKEQDHVGIVYASCVLARGIFQGVINITLGAYNWDPDVNDPTKVSREAVIVDRLRMDIPTARHLRRALSDLLDPLDAAEQPKIPDEIIPPKKPPVANGNDSDEEDVGLAAAPKPH